MNDVFLIFGISFLVFLTIILVLIILFPSKKLFCKLGKSHEFGDWEDFKGPSRSHHYQSKTCKKCGYREIQQTYIGR